MNELKMFLYDFVPKKIRMKLGGLKILDPLRNTFFRSKGTFVEVAANVKRNYKDYAVLFKFYGSIQAVNKAKKYGIENTLLNNSMSLLATKSNEKIVFDVGANFGYLSLVWANTICKFGKVYSFEPHPEIMSSYRKSVKFNNLMDVITPVDLAVGNQMGNIEISLFSTSSNTLSSVANKKNDRMATVEITTLDHYVKTNNIDQCDLVKIDVDGIEFDILNGSKELIKNLKPIFIVETNKDSRIIDFFIQQDYTILNMKLLPIEQGEVPSNVFCLPNK